MSLKIGDVIDDKYRIVRLLGEGGMGAVYEGENTRIARRVAIKILHASIASSQDAVQRFEREAQAAGRIGSEHIVEVLDMGELKDGDRYMVMEYLDGEALHDRIARLGKLPPQAAASIVVDMLEGLKAAHAAGIIHRDLKPDNVFLLSSKGGKKDFVKVVDFGISKFSTLGGEFSMTQTGAVMGTPYYLSPEQAKGERDVNQRSDLYAVGVILWEATAGRVPFEGETFNELLFKIVLEPIPHLADVVPGLDPTFVQIVEKAMARDPEQRFATADEMQSALRNWLAGQPIPSQDLEVRASRLSLDHTALSGGTPPTTIHRTQGNWANTNPESGETKSKMPWVLAAVALLALSGGGGLYATSVAEAEREAASLARAEQEAEDRAEEQARLTELARIEAERAQAEARRALAEKEKSEAEKDRAQAELTAAEQARLEAQEEKAKEEEERRRAAAIAAARRARAAAAAPSPKPSPAPSSSGRRIRTEL